MGIFSKFLGRTAPHISQSEPAVGPRPAQPVFVVGDLHGQSALLEAMLERIDAEIGGRSLEDPMLIFVGDLVDRGPDSAGVLRRMQELTDDFPDNVQSLMGNHEQMLLDFLESPASRQARWMRNGGLATCESFGVDAPMGQASAQATADALRAAMGDGLVQWVRMRPSRFTSGTLTCVHAGVDPNKPLEKQSDRVLTWGHPEFLSSTRNDGHWIAHGHTIVDEPSMGQNRIALDTGAFHTGTLTAAMILPNGETRFLSVS